MRTCIHAIRGLAWPKTLEENGSHMAGGKHLAANLNVLLKRSLLFVRRPLSTLILDPWGFKTTP